MENKFSWGDPVIVIEGAPKEFHPGEFASICGFNKIVSQETADAFQSNIGDWIYIIEFDDGSDVQIPEHYLQIYTDQT